MMEGGMGGGILPASRTTRPAAKASGCSASPTELMAV